MTKKKQQQFNVKVVVCAIICLTILELYAMCCGINGWLLRLVVIVIAGLAGLVLPQLKIRS